MDCDNLLEWMSRFNNQLNNICEKVNNLQGDLQILRHDVQRLSSQRHTIVRAEAPLTPKTRGKVRLYYPDGTKSPPIPYVTHIQFAFFKNGNNPMPLKSLYQWLTLHTDVHDLNKSSWQNSVRHNLSLNSAFWNVKDEKVWYVDPNTTVALLHSEYWQYFLKAFPGFMDDTNLSVHPALLEQPSTSHNARFYPFEKDLLGGNIDEAIYRNILNELSTCDQDTDGSMSLVTQSHGYLL
ncbi:uncharacterized protein B0I36DRAFT_355952 [Microdochium trichocladiopsis]|uniref:Fork-head domain-containing protein n=1 Tax=Microdochium trichocladiopsis TaxID=1682393 RepID=A0A9P8XR36_9PEZI|nr:uncharacterized protein B0I36DRAFT_355952 [Microdochium trichocladiopsis]KAH7012556.1 hypothetical protein B0I36DRAFT_355952 [Microdochium trichocladiopsis]